MTRVLKRTIYVLVTTLAALVVGVPAAAPDLGLQNVNLSCNDGTNLNLTLDPVQVTQLANAVSAINLYPAGDPPLSCRLTLPLLLSARTASASDSASANAPQDFAVGGGQYETECGIANFALSAHAPADTTGPPNGTWRVSVPAGSPCGQGSLNAKVDCLSVSGTTADTTELVTHANGFLEGLVGTELTVGAIDNSPDKLTVNGGIITNAPCDFGSASDRAPILHGNISVHDE